ncbi:YjcZ family sporulation protein [Paenibacillus sp. D2_2]|nr:YjcZ family sporulation protein [Paenibacillus sp. D2_2]WMT38910.1 YjcZ family sporulation protein [Paenibacillus sp. D2_2]
MGEVLGGVGYSCGGGLFTSTAAILVLFILLVIITRAFVF